MSVASSRFKDVFSSDNNQGSSADSSDDCSEEDDGSNTNKKDAVVKESTAEGLKALLEVTYSSSRELTIDDDLEGA